MRHVCAAVLALMITVPVTAAEEPRVWVACGYGGRRMVSNDGVKWTITEEWAQPGADDANNLMSAVYAQGKFVVVGGGGAGATAGGHVLVSSDGNTWREVMKASNRVNPVVFGGGRFLAGGPNRQLLVSSDGEKWTPGAKIEDKVASHFRHGAYGAGVFVLTGNHGGNGGPFWVAVTKDGTKIDHFSAELPAVRGLASSGSRFVIVNQEGQAYSSEDGRKWEKRVDDAGARFTNVVWTGQAFFASGAKAYVSGDGVTWKPLEQKVPCNVLWSDGKRFIGSTWPGQMWWSGDGKTWTKGEAMPANGINKVVWSGAK